MDETTGIYDTIKILILAGCETKNNTVNQPTNALRGSQREDLFKKKELTFQLHSAPLTEKNQIYFM